MLKIVQIPQKVLTIPALPVTEINRKIKKLVFDMEETLIAQVDPQGVGLAAPQVGISLTLFIMKPTPKGKTEVFINPKILKNVDSSQLVVHRNKLQTKNYKLPTPNSTKLEGCLSIPRIWGPVSRSFKVFLSYQDLEGKTISRWFSGFKATIIQHECDHLNGILFTQRAVEQSAKLFEEKNGELVPLRY